MRKFYLNEAAAVSDFLNYLVCLATKGKLDP